MERCGQAWPPQAAWALPAAARPTRNHEALRAASGCHSYISGQDSLRLSKYPASTPLSSLPGRLD